VTRRINQVENVLDAIGRMHILHLNGVALDRDAALAFEVHIVERLILHIALADGMGVLQQAVSQGAFSVVNVSDDAKIAYVLHVVMK